MKFLFKTSDIGDNILALQDRDGWAALRAAQSRRQQRQQPKYTKGRKNGDREPRHNHQLLLHHPQVFNIATRDLIKDRWDANTPVREWIPQKKCILNKSMFPMTIKKKIGFFFPPTYTLILDSTSDVWGPFTPAQWRNWWPHRDRCSAVRTHNKQTGSQTPLPTASYRRHDARERLPGTESDRAAPYDVREPGGAARGGAAGREGTASRLRGSAPGRAAAERPALRPPRARATASPHSAEWGGAERAAAIAYGARRLLAPRPAVSRERGGARAALERSVIKWWGAEATVTLPALPRAACPQHGALGIPAVRHAVPSGSRARDWSANVKCSWAPYLHFAKHA